MYSATKIINTLWDGLSDRQKEVLTGRFGLDKAGKTLTLAALGSKYQVTRERIRQIEASGIAVLRGKIVQSDACNDILERCRKFLRDNGGVAREEVLVIYAGEFAEGITRNQLSVLMEASRAFYHNPGDRNHFAFYYLDKQSLKSAVAFVDQWSAFLKTKKDQVLDGKYHDLLQEFLKKKNVRRDIADSYLSITKKIHQSPYGDIGLAEWLEIKPKTIRDRVYLALKKKKAPLHFRDIAKAINQMPGVKHAASAPTVHNDLIRDPRFVLVGRGMYALAEFGFEPGTAKEVISRILKKHGPLKPKEVIDHVQKVRFFKANTVLVNLQNKSNFERQSNGTYRMRES